MNATKATANNALFPIFVKFEQFDILIVGGGNVGLEKLNAVLDNSPEAPITLVGKEIREEIKAMAAAFPKVVLKEKPFEPTDLDGKRFAIMATDDPGLNRDIRRMCNERNILANVADTPDACDFYLSSVVRKGNLKIAISTNGKSPTIAKRLKETLQETLPNELDEVLDHMEQIRGSLKGDFAFKVKTLNHLTRSLAANPGKLENETGRNWKTIAQWSLGAFLLLVIANVVFITGAHTQVEPVFWSFLAVGFAAQLVDGLLGMGYGVTSAMGLMTLNIPAAAISSSIHTAEMFAAGVSGYSHYRFGNVSRSLVKRLLIPGVLGAVAGALLLSWFDGRDTKIIRPFLAAYTLLLGIRIIYRALRPNTAEKEVKRMGLLAGAGGFLDSFGGGGWGPLVTGTLISKGKTPRKVIGSVSLTEFFVTLASALTFFAAIGIGHWQVVLGLTLGGVIAAPLAARLAGRLPVTKMTIGVGLMVILWSLQILVKTIW